MLHLPAFLAGASLLLGAPLAAQVGLASTPRSVTLSATRLPSVAVMIPETATAGRATSLAIASNRGGSLALTTSWNVDPAEPLGITLLGFMDAPDETRGATLSGVARDDFTVQAAGLRGETYPRSDPAQSGRDGRAVPQFTRPIAALVGHGDRNDDVRVGTAGTLTLVAVTQ
jgi:hypothetical protein